MWKPIDNKEREKTPQGRFEIICEKYISGTEGQKAAILSCFSPEEKRTFLEGVGLYRLFTDQAYYNAVRDAVGERIYKELHETA